MSASSDPSPSSSAGLLRAHHPHPHHLHLSTPPPPVALAHAYPPAAPPPSPASAPRDYRKGNWTLHETLVLITAKRLDDDRRAGGAMSGGSASSSPLTPRSAEQRWKWVENYCWINGCLRSQNQCNDKWDNLLRDYKKVRDHETRRATSTAPALPAALPADAPGAGVAPPPPTPQHQQLLPSYWTMERHDRKERNLPTNLAPEVYDALVDVLSRRAARRGGNAIAPTATTPPMLALPPPPLPTPPPPPPPPPPSSPPKPQPQPLLAQQQHRPQHHPHPHPPPLLQLPPPVSLPSATSVSAEDDMSDSSESGSDGGASGDADEPEAKRRRRVERLGSSVVRSATVLARTLVACEDKRERRHREVLELEERRLRLEAERNEVRRQGFAGLVAAVNGLSGAIHALVASDHHHGRSGDSSRRS
ncbi:hypothetical protein QYE76_046936 [Lolium multiflorum]|uniref:Myb-like domain-containing protein n=2 Tax=Lolium TaxID=4520 RepID=A0AAD8X1I3_LOLMU|nr:hypothetical protein QYE76_046936 [Lolium multiflorum]